MEWCLCVVCVVVLFGSLREVWVVYMNGRLLVLVSCCVVCVCWPGVVSGVSDPTSGCGCGRCRVLPRCGVGRCFPPWLVSLSMAARDACRRVLSLCAGWKGVEVYRRAACGLGGRYRRTLRRTGLWRRVGWPVRLGDGGGVSEKVWALCRYVGWGRGGRSRAGAAILGGRGQAVLRRTCSLSVFCGDWVAAPRVKWRLRVEPHLWCLLCRGLLWRRRCATSARRLDVGP